MVSATRMVYFDTYKACRAFIEQKKNEGCTHITSNRFSDTGRFWVKYVSPTDVLDEV